MLSSDGGQLKVVFLLVADMSLSSLPTAPLDWKLSQVFGERGSDEEVQDGKLISIIIC